MLQCVCLCVDLCDTYCLSWRENAAFFPNQREKCVESGMATKIAGLTHSLSTLKYKFYPEGNSLFCLVQSTLHTYTHSEICTDSKVFIGTWEIINFVLSWQKWGWEIIYIVGCNSKQFKFQRIEFQQMPRKPLVWRIPHYPHLLVYELASSNCNIQRQVVLFWEDDDIISF